MSPKRPRRSDPPAPPPLPESQVAAAEAIAAELRADGSKPATDGILTALVGCARACDAEPTKAALWKEYRELLRLVASLSESDSVERRVVEFMSIGGGG